MTSADQGTDAWLEALFSGDRRALARAITLVENEGPAAADILARIRGHLGRAVTVGFTGPPGAGKSTLVNAFVRVLRERGRTVGVVAVDPSSPVTGGAILGDRIRMTGHSGDRGVFVRSLASRGHLGGLSRSAVRVIDCMDAAGLDVVVIETVGAGQSEVEIAEVADVKVVVAAPGLGDDVQAIKAGILEIADVLVVNKGDHPLSAQTARYLKTMVGMQAREPATQVLRTVATTGKGVEVLADTIERLGQQGRACAPMERSRRLLVRAAQDLLRQRLASVPPEQVDSLARALLAGEKTVENAALDLVRQTLKEPS
jgi:LAO/AO transport system kinase